MVEIISNSRPIVVEILQLESGFLAIDDLMDGSLTRRGHPCWYLVDSLGKDAFHDGLLMIQLVFRSLKIYFRSAP